MDENIYAQAEPDEFDNRTHRKRLTGARSSGSRLNVAVTVFLGLLVVFLLAVLFVLSVHCHVRALAAIKANLTERLQASEDELSTVSAERDLLNITLTEKTEELDSLGCSSTERNSCPSGWRMFNDSCYLHSTVADSWDNARQDCKDREADLVTIHSFEEQEFLSSFIRGYTWIGLHDRDNESDWKWVDGSPLTQAYWVRGWLDNGREDPKKSGEDCAEIIRGYSPNENWNDAHCDRTMHWMCEKSA